MLSDTLHTCLSEPTKKLNEDRPILTGTKIAKEGASNESGVVEVAIFASFARHMFRIFTLKATIIILCYVNWNGSRRWMHRKHGIDRGTEVTEESRAWGG